jgi:osmotically-inducible protein OsmY
MMKSSTTLQHDVLEELRWTSGLRSGEIGVSAHAGVVTLYGHVETYTQKVAAEKAAKRVQGVKGVANELSVKLASGMERDDTDIAEATVRALTWNSSVPEDRVRVTVRNGWVTLEGDVDWHHQKESAYRAVKDLTGVKAVVNSIGIKVKPAAPDIRQKIEAAFKRSAEIDAKNIGIEVLGSRAVLRGRVRSWAEHEEAEDAAWSAPGITAVENQLTVEEEVMLEA